MTAHGNHILVQKYGQMLSDAEQVTGCYGNHTSENNVEISIEIHYNYHLMLVYLGNITRQQVETAKPPLRALKNKYYGQKIKVKE